MSRALSSLIVIVLMSSPAFTQTVPAAEPKPAAKKSAPKVKAPTKEEVQAAAEADAESESDSAEGLTPYIEVEKYNSAKPLKESTDDRISVFAKFNTNNFDAEDQVTQGTFNFTTASDFTAGFEYTKAVSDNLHILTNLFLSHFSSAENLTLIPNLDANDKDLAAGSLGLRFAFTPDNYLDFLLNYHPHYYLKNNPATGNIILEHNLSPSASIGMKNFFYDTKDASVGLDINFEIITNNEPAGSGSTNSFAYLAGLIYRQNFKTGDNVAVEFSFRDSTTSTVEYELKNHTFALSFMYSLPY